MPRLVYFIACEKVLVGEEDKSPSLITLFDQVIVPVPPPEATGVQAGMRWSLVSYWLKLPEDEGKQYEQRTLLLSPDGEERGEVTLKFELTGSRHRNTIRVFGFPVTTAGNYLAKLSIREVGSQDWVEVTDYPISVIHSNDIPV